MILEERISVLDAVAEIAELPLAERATMAAALGEERFRAGETIIAAGETADRVLVLASGSAEVLRHGGMVRRLGRGALFGEIAFLTDMVRTATVTAATDCELLSLPFTKFRELLLRYPRGALALSSRIARELVEAEALLARATTKAGQPEKTTAA